MIWVVLIFIIPLILNSVLDEKTRQVESNYKLEFKKLSIINYFEKRGKNEAGSFDKNKIEIFRNWAEDYYKTEHPQILAVEMEMYAGMKSVLAQMRKWLIFFPTTYYTMVCEEFSSSGYENFLQFYRYVVEMHTGFLRFWIDRVYYCDPKELISFIGKEPEYLWLGFLLILFHILWLFTGTFYSLRRFLFLPAEEGPFLNKKDLVIRLQTKRINVLYALRPGLRDYFYRLLNGRLQKKEPSFTITLDGQLLSGKKKIVGFIYLCDVEDIPGYLTYREFVRLILTLNNAALQDRNALLNRLPEQLINQRFCQMERRSQVDALLTVLPYIKGSIFLFYHTCKDLLPDCLIRMKNQMQILVKQGATVIYLSPESSVNDIKKNRKREILPLDMWLEQVESLEFLDEEELKDTDD